VIFAESCFRAKFSDSQNVSILIKPISEVATYQTLFSSVYKLEENASCQLLTKMPSMVF
jgi:hypothetical protein